MEPENQLPPHAPPGVKPSGPVLALGPSNPAQPAQPFAEVEPYHGLHWMFVGPQGLRAGWSVLLFIAVDYIFLVAIVIAMAHFRLVRSTSEFTPKNQLFEEVASLLALILAVALMALIEGRRILAYNLTGPRLVQNFLFGLASGFVGLSALIGMLAAGGWLHVAPVALSGAAIFRYGLLWGGVFLLGGCFEEGMYRCYELFILARGLNFWWALATVAATCAYLAIFIGGSASWGVYAAALIGFFPCLLLHQKAAPRSGGFWYAAWVTSTLFGYIHLDNPNEAWIGIFAAACIGFVFCVSVRVTGSALWAIGCHAGWDWAETYFYGASDSGLSAHGSFLTSTPSGNALWSGGAVGPEGSLLVLAAILFLLALVLIYGRLSSRSATAAA